MIGQKPPMRFELCDFRSWRFEGDSICKRTAIHDSRLPIGCCFAPPSRGREIRALLSSTLTKVASNSLRLLKAD